MRLRVIPYDCIININGIMQLGEMAERLQFGSSRTVESPPSLNHLFPVLVVLTILISYTSSTRANLCKFQMFSNGTTTHVFVSSKASTEERNYKEWLNKLSMVSTSVLQPQSAVLDTPKHVRFRYNHILSSLKINNCGNLLISALFRKKIKLGTGETVVARTEEESTSSTMYEWLTKPVWKCFFGTL